MPIESDFLIVISIGVFLWALSLVILGIRQLHEITTGKAIIAVLIPFIALAVVLGLLTKALEYRML